MEKWIALLKETQLEISYESVYRLLSELYLVLNAGFDMKDFDFPPLDFDFDIPNIIIPPVDGRIKNT